MEVKCHLKIIRILIGFSLCPSFYPCARISFQKRSHIVVNLCRLNRIVASIFKWPYKFENDSISISQYRYNFTELAHWLRKEFKLRAVKEIIKIELTRSYYFIFLCIIMSGKCYNFNSSTVCTSMESSLLLVFVYIKNWFVKIKFFVFLMIMHALWLSRIRLSNQKESIQIQIILDVPIDRQ